MVLVESLRPAAWRGSGRGRNVFLAGGCLIFAGKMILLQCCLMQCGLGVFSIASIATGKRQLWTGLSAPENEKSLNLPLVVLDI